MLPELDLPPFAAKISQSATNQPLIWDGLRRKHVVLTPEEWVRQHVVHYLADHLGYPRGLLALERGLRYNQRQKRTDLLALDSAGKPLLLVECKAPTVAIDAAVAHQATTYNQEIGAPLLFLTNGLVHYCWHVNFKTRINTRLEDIPTFAEAGLNHEL